MSTSAARGGSGFRVGGFNPPSACCLCSEFPPPPSHFKCFRSSQGDLTSHLMSALLSALLPHDTRGLSFCAAILHIQFIFQSRAARSEQQRAASIFGTLPPSSSCSSGTMPRNDAALEGTLEGYPNKLSEMHCCLFALVCCLSLNRLLQTAYQILLTCLLRTKSHTSLV